MTDSQTEIDF